MVAFQGMDVEAIRSVAAGLDTRSQELAHVVGAIDGLVSHLASVWAGPDAQQFAGWWQQQHKPHLVAAGEAIHGLGQSAANNASEQEHASGGGGTAQAGHVPGGAAHAQPRPVAHLDSVPRGPQDYSASRSVAIAQDEAARHVQNPTGWNQQGECVKSVQRWIEEAGGRYPGGGPLSSLQSAGTEVQLSSLQPGDVLQRVMSSSPDSWDGSVHTVMVAGINSDGSLSIVQSNADYHGSVTEDDHWTPAGHLPAGSEWHAFRLAGTP